MVKLVLTFNEKKMQNCYYRIKVYILLILPTLLSVAVIAIFSFALFGCAGLKVPEVKNTEIAESVTESPAATTNSSDDSGSGPKKSQEEDDSTIKNGSVDTDDSASNLTEKPGQNYNSSLKDYDNNPYGIKDLQRQREYFIKGVEAFEKEDYVIAEYYFNQVKDTYLILQDHILYYLAKSLLLQDKFDYAQENYLKLKENFPDSIFTEKASLEYADLFFMQEQYLKAQQGYKSFIEDYSKSGMVPYSVFQLAACQGKTGSPSQALQNYKNIWLSFPESEYAEGSYSAMQSIIEENPDMNFEFSNDEIYGRGERFFELYMYNSAILEFMQVLENIKDSKTDTALEAKTLFKLGMCYFNLRDYKLSKDYLLLCYESYPAGSYADDSLYFLGRAETNLDRETQAISYYESLVKNFPQSNYADDALYRTGRIYFLNDDLESAAESYQKIADLYPSGDKINDAYWELGWIYYRSADYSAALDTFKNMAVKFKGSPLGEKALFWQAKSLEKTGSKEEALEIYRQITDLKSYTYYTFAAESALKENGITALSSNINTDVYPDNQEIKKLLPEVYGNLFNEDSGTKNNTVNEGNIADNSSAGTGPKTTSAEDENTGQDVNVVQDTVFTHTSKAKELLIIEFYSSADIEIEASAQEYEDDEFGLLQISTLYLLARDYSASHKIIAKDYTKLISTLEPPYKDYVYYLMYPYGFKDYIDKYSSQFSVDPLFILAVIREESRFNPEAGSYAGALGLMQVMPATGKGIANSLGIKDFSNDMLYDPETSIKMGAYYLDKQLDSFSQNKFYACGAYNGGPGAMSGWISRFKDKDIDEFIEHITYEETRNYVKKVMGSYYFYKMLYEKS